jgi:hypothetical protein
MKIEIDLNDILGSEFGDAESLAQSVKRQVIEQIKSELDKGIKKQIDSEISKMITDLIKVEIEKLMPVFVTEIMNVEYEKTTSWGEKQGKTTFRNEMIKAITGEMKYERKNYTSDQNAFTNAVQSVLESETKKFQSEFNSVVTKQFTADTVKIVTDELRKKFGI